MQVALHLPIPWRRRLVPRIMLAMAPWLMCHVHNIRTFAQLVTHTLLRRYPLDSDMWTHTTGWEGG